jgi:hypothetical protein
MHKGLCDEVSRLFKTYAPPLNDLAAVAKTLICADDFEMLAGGYGRDVHSYMNNVERWWPFRFPGRSGRDVASGD